MNFNSIRVKGVLEKNHSGKSKKVFGKKDYGFTDFREKYQ